MLNMPPLPPAGRYLRDWFWRIWSRRSGGGGMGASYMTAGDVRDFFEVRGIRPTPWEVAILFDMAAAAEKVVADLQDQQERHRKAEQEAQDAARGLR